MASARWRERFPDDVTCVRCLQVKPVQELDRLLWCEECLENARRRAAIRGWIMGGVVMIVLGIYIVVVIRPDWSLIPSAWVATLVVAFYLGGRLARELFLGWERLSNRPAVEATPPDPDDLSPGSEGGPSDGPGASSGGPERGP